MKNHLLCTIVLNGNLKLHAFNALIDKSFVKPVSSIIIVPFKTRAIHFFIGPDPLPIRLNNGFFVTGKLKLILSGFHEGALAARGCFKYARPDEKLRFEFSTTSKAAQERLGVKK